MADHFPNESNENSLTPARPEEVTDALSYALRYDEDHQHLERAGFVLMRKRPGRPHSAG